VDNSQGSRIEVRLDTAVGIFITDIIILPFSTMPDVIVWGERFFIPKNSYALNGTMKHVYREAFAYAAPIYNSVNGPFGGTLP